MMRILAFGIHPDDVELGCGGTVILAVSQGHDVIVADLSEGTASSNGSPEERAAEAAEAARVMGVRDRVNLGLPDTRIAGEDPEQVEKVVECIRDLRPDIVIVPSSEDPHPDHASGGTLVKRAAYLSGVHGYHRGRDAWPVRNYLIYAGRTEFEPHVIVDVSSTHDTKVRAILAHRSQFVAGEGRRPTPLNAPDFLEFIEARSRVYGRMIGCRYGEGFRMAKPFALNDLGLLCG
ncbi:MAG: bacillithiol biosynthesis deacetylase BshB1 [Candidatus Latescibacterota bacterium]|nr:MAG: bacillithiol biosynthesis deacetylase BshB1 [Candidatus Latescibacterota bacterium]